MQRARPRCAPNHAPLANPRPLLGGPPNPARLFVVRNQLCVHHAALHIPDGAGRVDRTGADAPRVQLVPVKGSQRGGKLATLVLQGAAGRNEPSGCSAKNPCWPAWSTQHRWCSAARADSVPNEPRAKLTHALIPEKAAQAPTGRGLTLFSSFSRRTPCWPAPGSSEMRHSRRKSPLVASRSGRVPSYKAAGRRMPGVSCGCRNGSGTAGQRVLLKSLVPVHCRWQRDGFVGAAAPSRQSAG